jgi:hypothetical protein
MMAVATNGAAGRPKNHYVTGATAALESVKVQLLVATWLPFLDMKGSFEVPLSHAEGTSYPMHRKRVSVETHPFAETP